MIKTSIEKLSYDIGYDIGHSDDVAQAKLLNGLCEALGSIKGDHLLDMQLCYIHRNLTPQAKAILESIVEFNNLI